MNESTRPAPAYRWAAHSDPDFLVLQLPPAPVVNGGVAHDAMKALFAQRGFRPVEEADRLDLRAANGCAITRTGPATAELLVAIGQVVGASRIPLTDLDPRWLDRSVTLGHAAVLIADAAIGDDGSTSQEVLRRDVDAGGVLAALVPVTDGP